jgi:aminoglycoside phosphotransferase (APT) family kinase protein
VLAAGADVVCHGDYGPWNLIWRDGLPVAIIDFDNAAPGARADDVGYALWKHLNPGLVPLDAPEQARRGEVFRAAYGIGLDVVEAIEVAQAQAAARFASHGWDLAELNLERAWLAAHRAGLAGEARAGP